MICFICNQVKKEGNNKICKECRDTGNKKVIIEKALSPSLVKMPEPIIEYDIRSKPYCILCLDSINQKKYLDMGNFCQTCNARCGALAIVWPGERPWPEDKKRLKEWIERKESYDRMSERFQESLIPKDK